MAAEDKDMNRDTLSNVSGSHPVATGVGAAGGAAAGIAAGTVGGPVGMAVGGVVGAVVGGLAGRAAGEAVNPTDEEAHWRARYTDEPYYEPGRSFDDYGPAYRHGMDARTRFGDWDEAQPNLASEWESRRAGSSLDWDQAQSASRAAWDRVDSAYRDSGDLKDYGTGMASTDSSLRTGRSHAGSADAGDDYDDVGDTLEDLLEDCRDGEYGFNACAEQAKRPDLKNILMQRAQDCRRAAQELQQCMRQHGGDVDEGGSALSAVHRGWVSVKASLSSYDDKAVMEEAERGEDNALARYRRALKKSLPADVAQIVQRQCEGVQRNHDQIRDLRDQLAAG